MIYACALSNITVDSASTCAFMYVCICPHFIGRIMLLLAPPAGSLLRSLTGPWHLSSCLNTLMNLLDWHWKVYIKLCVHL